jgi:hypothetical protein
MEYSKDFNFFKANQIAVSKSGKKYRFYSRIEKFTFLIVDRGIALTDTEIENRIKFIHKNILSLI